ncbi:MAG: hypothetical protein R2706_07795 [Acidimicrobiales bacterium]
MLDADWYDEHVVRRIEPVTKPNILFVCTANICRSPTAEYLARARFGLHDFRFASAGFMRSDETCPADLTKVLDKRGVDVTPHRSHTVNQETLDAADLVLTMEAQHVQNIAIKFPDSFAKTLPLVEAAERLRGRRVSVGDFVGEIQSRDPMSYLGREWDVDDPYKRGTRRYRKAVEQIDGLVETVLAALS